jgi:phospholipid transport system transporter-binding protein
VSTRLEGDRLLLEGNVDAETVPALLASAAGHVAGGLSVVDFAGVRHVDSSAVALALEWVRSARAAGRTVAFRNVPPAMVDLAQLYDVADLLTPGASQ